MEKVLTERQELFCQVYVDTSIRYDGRCNATKAALQAGYAKKSARQQGSRLLSYVNIQKRIDELKEERRAYLEVTREKIIEEYAKIGFADLSEYLNEWGYVSGQDLKRLPKHLTAAIKSIEKVTNLFGVHFKITLHDKKGALDSLAKIEGMIKEKEGDIEDPKKIEELFKEISNRLIERDLEDPVSDKG